MNTIWEAAKFNNKWAVFCKVNRAYILIGKGKRFCERKAKELNMEECTKFKKIPTALHK